MQRSQIMLAQFKCFGGHEGGITICHTPPATTTNFISVIETGIECQDEDADNEKVAGGPRENVVMSKVKLDESVETITTNEIHK